MMIIIFHQLDTVWCDFNKLSPPLILFYYWSQLHKPWNVIKPLKEHLKRHFKLNPRVKRLEFLATYATDGKSSLRCSESILTQHCLKYTHMSSAEERKTDTDCRSLRKKNYIMAAFKEKVFFANFKFFLFFFFSFNFLLLKKNLKSFFFLHFFFAIRLFCKLSMKICQMHEEKRVNEWSYNRDQYVFIHIYIAYTYCVPSWARL